jgi:hypothetical protein
LLYTALEREALEQGDSFFLEDQAKSAPSARALGVHCSGSWLPISILDVYG